MHFFVNGGQLAIHGRGGEGDDTSTLGDALVGARVGVLERVMVIIVDDGICGNANVRAIKPPMPPSISLFLGTVHLAVISVAFWGG